MLNQKWIGTWELISFEIEDLEGNRKPWGKNTHGLLIYTPTGHMSVSINKEIELSGEGEAQDIFNSTLFYAGTYSINQGDEVFVRHHVTEASNPSRIGKEMLRHMRFFTDSGENTLELSSPKESFGRGIIIWKKIE